MRSTIIAAVACLTFSNAALSAELMDEMSLDASVAGAVKVKSFSGWTAPTGSFNFDKTTGNFTASGQGTLANWNLQGTKSGKTYSMTGSVQTVKGTFNFTTSPSWSMTFTPAVTPP